MLRSGFQSHTLTFLVPFVSARAHGSQDESGRADVASFTQTAPCNDSLLVVRLCNDIPVELECACRFKLAVLLQPCPPQRDSLVQVGFRLSNAFLQPVHLCPENSHDKK